MHQGKSNRRKENKPFPARKKKQLIIKTKKKTGPIVKKQEPELIRLNKFIADSGLCSRREADEYIKQGLVTVNKELVTEMGKKVSREDEVYIDDKRIASEKKVYLVLNKPKDYITTVKDKHAGKTVMDLIQNACKERVYPVGRLDRQTTGVLLFTNDGDLAKRIMHPSFKKKKIYHAYLDKKLKKDDFEAISRGIDLDDGFIKPDRMNFPDPDDLSEVGIEIHSGKNRIVRRMFEHFGYRIKKLDRVYYAGLTKKNLPRGKWRFLNEKEISMLKMGAFE